MVLTLIFLLFLLLSFATFALLTRETRWEKTVQQRVEALQVRPHSPALPDAAERILKPTSAGRFPRLDQFFERFQFSAGVQRRILHAGMSWTVGTWFLYSVAAGVIVLLLSVFFFPIPALDGMFAIAGLCIPSLYLKHLCTRRLLAFNNGLPDAIDLMARALRAGHSLSSAIEVLSDQAVDAVAVEFQVIFRQQNFGLPLRDALLQMADRVSSKDLRFLVTAMLVQKETGGNLTEILDRTAHVIRERVRIEGEVRVRTAQGRLTGWILSLLPVILLLMLNLVDPGYSHVLLNDPTGRILLYTGAGLIVIGSFIIRRIVNIEV